jgi:alpha-galactosidase/6-phospho-beta-glucosidase family protein
LKIAFIGAGSVVFTKNLLTDTLSLPELHGTTIALHDIDTERLETAGMMARWTRISSAQTRRSRSISTGEVRSKGPISS